MVTVNVKPGVCRFDAVINVKKVLSGEVEISITSQCPNLKVFKEALSKVKISEAVAFPNRNVIIRTAVEILPHSACPLPCAIVKAVEAEVGFALKRDVTISFEKSVDSLETNQ